MAASGPPPNIDAPWMNRGQRLTTGGDTTGRIEVGMSNMNLMPSSGAGDKGPPSSGNSSNMEASQGRRHSGSVDSGHLSQLSEPSSPPSTQRHNHHGDFAEAKSSPALASLARPPGLGGGTSAMQQRSADPGHSKQSSASTAQSLTLTPASSLDGSSDVHSTGRQSSPFHTDGPSIPNLRTGETGSRLGSLDGRQQQQQQDFPKGITTFGMYEGNITGNDGLLGLAALRDRAMSSPGPTGSGAFGSSSSLRGQHLGSPNYLDESMGRNAAAAAASVSSPSNMGDHRRPRAVPKETARGPHGSRPPLSGGATGMSPHTENSSYHSETSWMGINAAPLSNNRMGGSAASLQPQAYLPAFDAGPGVISRPDAMLDAALRRSISADTGAESMQDKHYMYNDTSRNQGGMMQPDPSKGASANRGGFMAQHSPNRSHPQHLMYPNNQGMYRHERSMSQSDMSRSVQQYDFGMHDEMGQARRNSEYGAGTSSQRPPTGYDHHNDMRYYSGQQSSGQQNIGGMQHQNQMHGRSMSMEQSPIPADAHSHDTQNLQRRSSALATSGGYYNPQVVNDPGELQRRQSLDFTPGQGRHGHHERLVSPGQSPMHTYSGHSRHPSDMGSSIGLSNSPASMNSGGMRNVHGHNRDMYGPAPASIVQRGHRTMVSDDDFAHPLMGENIEVPGDDNAYMVPDHRSHHAHARRQSSPEMHHMQNPGHRYHVPKIMYSVKFKRMQRSFVLGPRLNRDLKMGTYVKVEADRGEDLGIVVGRVPNEKASTPGRQNFRANSGEAGMIPPPGGPSAGGAAAGAGGVTDSKRITRLATHDEVALLAIKRDEEEALLQVCRTKVQQRALPMRVVDAEYQFDRHKLTFFFEAEGRVDFRELVRDLFSIYKTRIWMQQLDKATSSCPAAPAPSNDADIDYSTPIIAPVSEFSDYAQFDESTGEADAN